MLQGHHETSRQARCAVPHVWVKHCPPSSRNRRVSYRILISFWTCDKFYTRRLGGCFWRTCEWLRHPEELLHHGTSLPFGMPFVRRPGAVYLLCVCFVLVGFVARCTPAWSLGVTIVYPTVSVGRGTSRKFNPRPPALAYWPS